MGMRETRQPTYDGPEDRRTKQSFRDETDINKILKRAQKTGTISHLNQHQPQYADFSNFDFFANTLMLTQGREIFDDLPSELRNEFNQSPQQFFTYVNDPANVDRLAELLPGLAEPGRQNITTDNQARTARASEARPSETASAEATAGPTAETPPTAAEAASIPPESSGSSESVPST